MLSSSVSYDILCYPLKNNFYDKLENPIQVKLDKVFSDVENCLIGKSNLEKFSVEKMSDIFDLRMEAMAWLFENSDLENLSEVIEESSEDFNILLSKDSNYLFLVENLKYALRVNKRYIDFCINEIEKSPSTFEQQFKPEAFKLTFEQYTNSIAMAIPDEELAQSILDLIGASLKIEFSLICAWILVHNNIQLSIEKIKELTSLVGKSAQDFSAISLEWGIGKKIKSEPKYFIQDNNFVSEQSDLADLGLDDLIDL